MSICLDKLAHVQVIFNCPYSIAQMCNCEDMLAHNSGAPYFDDVATLRTFLQRTHFYHLIAKLVRNSDPLCLPILGAIFDWSL